MRTYSNPVCRGPTGSGLTGGRPGRYFCSLRSFLSGGCCTRIPFMSRNGEVVIAGACRTPIGKFLGGLASFKAPALGALAIREALTRARVAPDQVDEVIMGQVVQAGSGQAPARQAAI